MRPGAGGTGGRVCRAPAARRPQYGPCRRCLCQAAALCKGALPRSGGRSRPYGRVAGGGLPVRLRVSWGAGQDFHRVPAPCQLPSLPQDSRRPAQRGRVRYRAGIAGYPPGGADNSLHRGKACPRELPGQGILWRGADMLGGHTPGAGFKGRDLWRGYRLRAPEGPSPAP